MGEQNGGSAAKPSRPSTLRQIAQTSGVHVSTVSRVLRQQEPPDGWSESARRIREVAEDLGYQPNLWAASLRTRRTTTIGVVMSRLTDGVIATTYQGIESAAGDAGYSVLLSSPDDELEAQRRSIELLLSRQVDGLILSSMHEPADEFLATLSLGDVPVLLINRHADSAQVSVTSDDHHGGYLAARHLLELGHTKFGVIAGPEHASTARDRVAGFLAGLRESGVSLRDDFLVRSDFEVAGGVCAAKKLLDRADRPTAIFSVNDTAAIGVLGVARDLRLSVPEDLSLIGYNDIPVVSQLPVPLTTLRSPARNIGVTGVKLLLELIRGRDVDSVRLPVELIRRASTGAPANRRR
ncbi:LacI family DNA-binding transcriptional regulator [Saxibacter everestensis]|uniref:LacI family DNA-binding transcriptional regulator n=1 Tax=Saxibacter everestensis TaxID=2909229 RepID=A0ABY8QYU0_9MICO|nr:LacI family DNA-binding transcriptional regulator [Brevibacteriaceae bacterium ZFBP1038]